MKMLRAAFFVVLNLLVASPAIAQWQTPDHSVPVGNGVGVTGFNAAVPGTAGLPLASNGASADPSFQLLTAAGITSNAITNALLATAPANTAKCNPTGSTAAIQDCTGAQLISSLGIAPIVNIFTASHTLVPSDCGNTVQMGTGASGQLGLVIPASPLTNGFTGSCPIEVFNGNVYSPGVSAGVIVSGAVPANQFYIAFPQQSFELKISGGAFVAPRATGRWGQTGPQIFAAKSTGSPSDTANDCLSLTNPCLTITHAMSILYQRADNMNGSPRVILNGGDSFPECVQVQGQLTGVNVGFIQSASGTGTSGGAIWGPVTGSCPNNSLLTISDNAEWEIQNILMTNASGTSGIDGIHMHQTGVIDVLSGMAFGSFPGATTIGSDNNSMINIDAGYQINAGVTTPTFFGIGPGTTLNECGACTTTFSATPAITTMYAVNGAGATVNFGSSHTFSGASNITNACSVNGPSMISLSGNTIPGTTACTSGSAAHNGVVF